MSGRSEDIFTRYKDAHNFLAHGHSTLVRIEKFFRKESFQGRTLASDWNLATLWVRSLILDNKSWHLACLLQKSARIGNQIAQSKGTSNLRLFVLIDLKQTIYSYFISLAYAQTPFLYLFPQPPLSAFLRFSFHFLQKWIFPLESLRNSTFVLTFSNLDIRNFFVYWPLPVGGKKIFFT